MKPGEPPPHGGAGPEALPGPAALTLLLRGGLLELLAVLCVVPIALQSLMPQ